MTYAKTRAALAALFLSFAASAGAEVLTGDCIALVGDARATIEQATTFQNERDRTGLMGKADSAATKIDALKLTDAAEVLNDMAAKVATLAGAAKPKLGVDDAAVITMGINAAQGCVAALATQVQ